jgi:hypothetical protein
MAWAFQSAATLHGTVDTFVSPALQAAAPIVAMEAAQTCQVAARTGAGNGDQDAGPGRPPASVPAAVSIMNTWTRSRAALR